MDLIVIATHPLADKRKGTIIGHCYIAVSDSFSLILEKISIVQIAAHIGYENEIDRCLDGIFEQIEPFLWDLRKGEAFYGKPCEPARYGTSGLPIGCLYTTDYGLVTELPTRVIEVLEKKGLVMDELQSVL